MPPLPLRAPPDPTPALAALTRTLSDVRTYQLPRLRGCTAAALARDLAAEARADLESVRAGLEESREACESVADGVRGQVVRMWEGVEGGYLEARDEFRAALMMSKRATADAARKHELLYPGVDEVPRAEATTSVGGDDALMTKTNEVTDAMRRTAQLLQAELEKSVLSTQMLDESTRTLKTTNALYDSYTALLSTSAQLVRALERADWWDRVLIMGALGLFLLCVGYVVKRRVLDRVGGFAAWWIGGSVKLVRKGLGGGGKAAGAVASVAAPAVAGLTGAAAGVGTVAGAGAGAGAAVAQGSVASVAGTLLASGAAAAAAAGTALVEGGRVGVGAGAGAGTQPPVAAGQLVEEKDGDTHGGRGAKTAKSERSGKKNKNKKDAAAAGSDSPLSDQKDEL